ncbi:MAG TPA: GNAT family N-acetyltransferase [Usitatibacter sp.]|nr:GNAT family N-acetyltransferase [Usitatibacter sp.]
MEEPVLKPARADFAIRAALPADVRELLRLFRELAVYEKLEHMAAGTEPMLHEALFGARPAAEAMVAERGGRAVGFALYFTTFSTFLCKPGLYLEDLFVEPAHRGLGIGKALLRELAALAARRGCGRLEWRVLDWNEPSIRFYESLGASLLKEWILVRMTRDELEALAKSKMGSKMGSDYFLAGPSKK